MITPVIFVPHIKSKRQKEQQRLAKQRERQCQRRLVQTMKQVKQKLVFSQIVLKRSKHLKQWRERKLILTENMVSTFKIKKDQIFATQWIPLKTITSCVNPVLEKNDPEGSFMLSFYGEDKNQAKINFRFSCKTKDQRDNWVKLIKSRAPNCQK